jgi:hypothetical protein
VEAIDSLLSSIPAETVLSSDETSSLLELPTRGDLLMLLSHAPKSKSPGLDGLPFELYSYLFQSSLPFGDLLVSVLQDAFGGAFPSSWQQTRMVLLYKKGDPQLLANWRPLSLINSDAKLFTKLLANRFNRVLPKLINPYQTGFLPNRLISDNGWFNQLIMSHLRSVAPSLPSVAVLLDQEKAYDRVHPEYLRLVLLRFGFPGSLVSALSSLFFGTQISVSVNGWLGAPISQLRGLRQGDPLSPLLFNLAFEPLLLSLLSSPGLAGVGLESVDVPRTWRPSPAKVHVDPGDGTGAPWPLDFVSGNCVSPPTVKLLAYADDLEVFLSSPDEWLVLLSLLELYGRASNAKVNLSKTVLVSLSGVGHSAWAAIASSAGIEWHDSRSVGSVRYLGYPLYHTDAQLAHYLDDILLKLQRHANLLKERHLSIRGAGLVANSLLLSKVYHVLRVVPAPSSWLQAVKKVVREYLVPFKPGVSWSTLCLPRKFGGVGLVDIEDQSFALHLIYLQRLLSSRLSSLDFVSPWLVWCFQVYTGHASILPWFMFPMKFNSRLVSLPCMAHLTKLLSRLPALEPSSSWSSRWYLDLPLCCIVKPIDSRPPPVNVASLPARYLLSDLARWLPHAGIVTLNSINVRTGSLVHKVSCGLRSSFSRDSLCLPAVIRSSVALADEDSASLAPSPGATAWLPSCPHWCLPTGGNHSVMVSRLSLGALRRYWHKDSSFMLTPPHPPMFPRPNWFLRPSFWRLFWSLELPPQAFTPWWRLLHGHIGTRAFWHRLTPATVESPFCRLCSEAPEDAYHFVIGCRYKSAYWREVLQFLSLGDSFPRDLQIWSALTNLCGLYSRSDFDEAVLTI